MPNVIHVDNSDFFRKQVKIFLADIGFESESYGRGEDALNAVATGGVSYVLTGLELSDMGGEELIKKLTDAASHVPIIVITSSENSGRTERLQNLGVEAILGKSGNWKGELNNLLR